MRAGAAAVVGVAWLGVDLMSKDVRQQRAYAKAFKMGKAALEFCVKHPRHTDVVPDKAHVRAIPMPEFSR